MVSLQKFSRGLRLCQSLFCTLALLLVSIRVSADEKASRIIKDVELTLTSLQTLTMDISGTVHDRRPDYTPLITFTGKARLKRPNLARIDYQQVAQKSDRTVLSSRGVIAADGRMLWSFDPDANEYRKSLVAPHGNNISVAGSPIGNPIYMFFHSRVVHSDSPPTYVGEETWNRKSYRVVEFREASANPMEAPLIRQRIYIGKDNLIYRFVNEQLQGKYVAEWTLHYIQPQPWTRPSNFAYVPPPGAKEHIESLPPMLAVGTVAPDLTVEGKDGKSLKLSDMRGKIVVLDFWTIGCGHCIESLSHLNTVAQTCAKDTVIMALNVGDAKETFSTWLTKHAKYNALLFALAPSAADKERATILYQVQGFPTQYVIGRDGKIMKCLLGYDGPTPDLENAIRAAGGRRR